MNKEFVKEKKYNFFVSQAQVVNHIYIFASKLFRLSCSTLTSRQANIAKLSLTFRDNSD